MNIQSLLHNSSVKKGALFTLFSFANNGISFLLLIILANYITPNEYGQLNLFNILISLLSIFISLSTTGYIPVSFFNRTSKEFKDVINTVLLTSTSLLVLICFILLIFNQSVEKWIGISIQYQFTALLICYMQIYTSINLEIWRIKEKVIAYGLYSLSSVAFNFVITLLLIIVYHKGWLGRVYAQITVAFIFFILSTIIILKGKYLTFKMPEKKTIIDTLKFGIPLIPHNISFWFRQGLDRNIINFFFTTTEVGIFSFAMNFANIISIVGNAFNATNSVFIYKQLSNKNENTQKLLKKQEHIMFLFFLGLSIITFISVSLLIPIFLPKYKEAIYLLPPLCISAFFQCVYLLYVNYLFFYKRTRLLMYITFSLSLLQGILSLLFTKYGIMITAYISLFISVSTTFFVYICSRKLTYTSQSEIKS